MCLTSLHNRLNKQAGTEHGQAQLKLELKLDFIKGPVNCARFEIFTLYSKCDPNLVPYLSILLGNLSFYKHKTLGLKID